MWKVAGPQEMRNKDLIDIWKNDNSQSICCYQKIQIYDFWPTACEKCSKALNFVVLLW